MRLILVIARGMLVQVDHVIMVLEVLHMMALVAPPIVDLAADVTQVQEARVIQVLVAMEKNVRLFANDCVA